MSLDVYLSAIRPTQVFDYNITHNLGKMASEVKIGKDKLTLYDYLWHPEKCNIQNAGELIPSLIEGLTKLKNNPKKYKRFNPPNGWGNYEGLVEFVLKYLEACEQNPDAKIIISI